MREKKPNTRQKTEKWFRDQKEESEEKGENRITSGERRKERRTPNDVVQLCF